ncbi:MAG: porin family protein [Kangiellaceae bacterium]
MKTLIALSALSLGTISLNTTANETDANQVKKHTFGLTMAAGSAEYKGSSDDGDGVSHLYAFYNYQFNDTFSFETGIAGGADLDDWNCEEISDNDWECRSDNNPVFGLQANELYYGNVIVAAKASFPISAKNSLYVKAGGQFYDYEFKRNNTKLDSDDGFGAFFEAGWQYRWYSGWGVNAGYQYMDMGDLEVSSLNAGVSYSF